jgi:hypothetical protein
MRLKCGLSNARRKAFIAKRPKFCHYIVQPKPKGQTPKKSPRPTAMLVHPSDNYETIQVKTLRRLGPRVYRRGTNSLEFQLPNRIRINGINVSSIASTYCFKKYGGHLKCWQIKSISFDNTTYRFVVDVSYNNYSNGMLNILFNLLLRDKSRDFYQEIDFQPSGVVLSE